MSVRKRGKHWMFDLQVNGQRYRQVLKEVHSESEAKAIEHEVYMAALLGQQHHRFAESDWRQVAFSGRAAVNATGIVSELVVAADLTRRGYDIYMPLTRGSGCDLIVVKRGHAHPMRLEVKTGYVEGGMVKTTGLRIHQRDLHDVLAIVAPVTSEIRYSTDPDQWFANHKMCRSDDAVLDRMTTAQKKRYNRALKRQTGLEPPTDGHETSQNMSPCGFGDGTQDCN